MTIFSIGLQYWCIPRFFACFIVSQTNPNRCHHLPTIMFIQMCTIFFLNACAFCERLNLKWTTHRGYELYFNLFHSNQKIKSNLFSFIGWLNLSACPSVNYKSWIVPLRNPVSSMSHEQKSVITVTDKQFIDMSLIQRQWEWEALGKDAPNKPKWSRCYGQR